MKKSIFKFGLITLSTLFLFSCKGTKDVVAVTPEVEQRQLDTLVIKPQEDVEFTQNPYQATNTIEIDMMHLDMDVQFNWGDESLTGTSTITFKTHFYPQTHLVLDAKGFEIKSVKDANGKELSYDYNNKQIDIDLGKTIIRGQTHKVTIDYIARPNDYKGLGGSAAISSDKGLYFINADGSNTDSPQQIWTQGETQSNSMWMPIIDSPNQKVTTTLKMTVQDKFQTLSNGLMTATKKLDNNMRVDTWTMDIPHAPYLVMMTVGDFSTTHDTWNGIGLDYMVEHEFKDDAADIFPHTPEMLTYFSERLGVPFPWQKYSQVIVREYVSGAMENTTAVVFGDFIQKHKGDLIDNGNDYIVAHEMMHHWFGDYLTTESWSNLTLNEGFANYSESLWQEEKYGIDARDQHLRVELNGYLQSSLSGTHPLIDYHYGSREDMFDAHSYNKGGCTLHMLRTYLGDDAFFEGLKVYLQDNALGAVEIHDLRLALEKISGEDLNWFFDQWFLTEGHPVLNVTQDYNAEFGTLNITLDQSLNRNEIIYNLPMAIDIYDKGGNITREMIRFSALNETITFDVPSAPALVIVDAEHALVGEINHVKSSADYAFQYKNAKAYAARFEALTHFESEEDSALRNEILSLGLKDPFWELRKKAIIGLSENQSIGDKLSKIVTTDPHAKVRAEAMSFLGLTGDKKYTQHITETLAKEKSNLVIGAGLGALTQIDPNKAFEMAQTFEKTNSSAILKSLSDIYFEGGKTEKLAFFEKNIANVKQEDAIYFLMNYGRLSTVAGGETLTKNIETLHQLGLSKDQSMYTKIGATTGLAETAGMLQGKDEAGFMAAVTALKDIISNEKNPQLMSYYKQMMGQ